MTPQLKMWGMEDSRRWSGQHAVLVTMSTNEQCWHRQQSKNHSSSCTVYGVHWTRCPPHQCSGLDLRSNRFTARAPLPHPVLFLTKSCILNNPCIQCSSWVCALSWDLALYLAKYIRLGPHSPFWLNDAVHTQRCFVAQERLWLQIHHGTMVVTFHHLRNPVLHSSFHMNHLRGNCITTREGCHWCSTYTPCSKEIAVADANHHNLSFLTLYVLLHGMQCNGRLWKKPTNCGPSENFSSQ